MSTVEELKTDNIQLVRRCFYCGQNEWTRPQLSGETGLSMAGVTNVLKILTERCEIRTDGTAPSTGGRRSKIYRLNPDYGHIGILFLSHPADRFLVSAKSIDLEGRCICSIEPEAKAVPEKYAEHSPGPDDILEICRELIRRDSFIRCLVVSFPGIVTSEGESLKGDFPNLSNLDITKYLGSRLNIPIAVENDVNLAVNGYSREHPESHSLAVLYQPAHDPAGAGLFTNGRIIKGSRGFAGEIGYLCHDSQMELLKSDPLRLVTIQLKMLAAVTAPERIAWYGPSLPEHTDILLDDIPEEFRPVLEQKSSLEDLIRSGAELAGRNTLLNSLL